jgi:hypothetical protein
MFRSCLKAFVDFFKKRKSLQNGNEIMGNIVGGIVNEIIFDDDLWVCDLYLVE